MLQKDTKKFWKLNGVGYRAAKSGNKLTLNLGYSHPVEMEDPEGVETVWKVRTRSSLKVSTKKKLASMQLKSETREDRSHTKGKGIKYADEVIRRKVGKTGKK